MTRRDYVLIAAVFNKKIQFMRTESADITDEFISLASDLSEALKVENPAFNKERFMDAVTKS